MAHWPTGSYSLLFSDYTTFHGHPRSAVCRQGIEKALFMILPGDVGKEGHQSCGWDLGQVVRTGV
jgi:hypothetical protein